jgi:hypothetical protein
VSCGGSNVPYRNLNSGQERTKITRQPRTRRDICSIISLKQHFFEISLCMVNLGMAILLLLLHIISLAVSMPSEQQASRRANFAKITSIIRWLTYNILFHPLRNHQALNSWLQLIFAERKRERDRAYFVFMLLGLVLVDEFETSPSCAKRTANC